MGPFRHLHERFHRARAALFVKLIDPPRGATVLDLGGSDGSLAAKIHSLRPLRFTVADITDEHRTTVHARGFEHRIVTEGGRLPFGDGEFDYVLCNSVIEHATLPKERCGPAEPITEAEWRREARRAQLALCTEIARVGRGYFVQTPDKRFPIDQHVILPFVQHLSHRNAARLVSFTDRWWIKKCGAADWELFTPEPLAAMLPDAAIHVETLLGLPKSIVAFRRSDAGSTAPA